MYTSLGVGLVKKDNICGHGLNKIKQERRSS